MAPTGSSRGRGRGHLAEAALHLQARVDADSRSAYASLAAGEGMLMETGQSERRSANTTGPSSCMPRPRTRASTSTGAAFWPAWGSGRAGQDYTRFLAVTPDDGAVSLLRHLADAHLSELGKRQCRLLAGCRALRSHPSQA